MSSLLQILCGPKVGNVLRVEIRYTLPDRRATAAAEVPGIASPQDEEAIRWYLEEYLLYPFDPAPELAARVERRMEAIGAELFRHVFESSADVVLV